MSWGNGSGVPTSGSSLVLVGTDTAGQLHIRIFNTAGNRTDTDETKLPAAKAAEILTLKQQLPGLLLSHVLTGAEKAQVLQELTSILDQAFFNHGDPETPIFEVTAGMPTRFRVVMPSTTSANSAAQPPVFTIHGHGWQDEPYVKRSTEIGHNDMAQFIGSQEVTVTQKYDIVIDSAGGRFQVPGDYLYQAFNQEQRTGIWGLFRVRPATK
jgi:hypothetical protein